VSCYLLGVGLLGWAFSLMSDHGSAMKRVLGGDDAFAASWDTTNPHVMLVLLDD